MWMAAVYWRTHRLSCFACLRVGSHMTLSQHSSNEPGELWQWPRHDDSTIDIVIGIKQRVASYHTTEVIAH